MSKKRIISAEQIRAEKEQAALEEQRQAEKDKKADFRASLIFLYFVACLVFTAIATDKGIFTYGQVSIVYLPMFFIFIYWLLQRMKDPDNKHGKLGNMVGIVLCIVAIVMTLLTFILSAIGLVG